MQHIKATLHYFYRISSLRCQLAVCVSSSRFGLWADWCVNPAPLCLLGAFATSEEGSPICGGLQRTPRLTSVSWKGKESRSYSRRHQQQLSLLWNERQSLPQDRKMAAVTIVVKVSEVNFFLPNYNKKLQQLTPSFLFLDCCQVWTEVITKLLFISSKS